ncbi:hypothetical protein ACA910_012865 [Epithemia clementina (nom. ined.)]
MKKRAVSLLLLSFGLYLGDAFQSSTSRVRLAPSSSPGLYFYANVGRSPRNPRTSVVVSRRPIHQNNHARSFNGCGKVDWVTSRASSLGALLKRGLQRHSSSKRVSSALCAADIPASLNSIEQDDTNNDDKLFESFGKGIIRDYKARLPLFWSDIADGLNVQCLAATLFLFFACLSPAVGFGALYGVATNGAIGTVEMVGSTAMCGVIFALTAAQPCTIIGSTGPVLSFVVCLAQLAKSMNLPFLPLYAWTGLWTSLILFVSSVTSASNLVKYLTRFTDEIFSTLISVIFVVEAMSGVLKSFSGPLTTALLTVVCAATTYTVATILKNVRKSTFFNKTIRTAVSNFAPTIAVAVASFIAWWTRSKYGALATLPSLAMPSTFSTTTGRPWLIPIFDLPMWACWAASIPALMATVLLFLDQNITVRLVNNPRWKMTKGRRENNYVDGMHADMLVISLLTAVQSILGIPWLVAATVRSLSHVGALSEFNSKGDVVGTKEQRVTGVAIHSLIGMSILLDKPRQLLTQIPLPVLLGLFMYLGTATLPGNEMWERFLDLFRDKKIAPKQRWSEVVPRNVSRNFTLIQLLCLGAMFYVKESPAGVLFPVLIALLAPLRFGLEKTGFIRKEYIEILDED